MDYDNKREQKLLLFLSADLINATAFKNAFHDTSNPRDWIKYIEIFHHDFPTLLKQYFGNEKIEIWKSLGDELIFCLELRNNYCACLSVIAFWHTLRRFNNETKKKMDIEQEMNINIPKDLGVKGTAWVADFPDINIQIDIPKINDTNTNDTDRILDFIGPQMDIGFRLTKFADRRRLIVSVELASLMVESTSKIMFFYDGRQTLKGALNNQPYPIIWVSLNEKLGEIDDDLYKQCETKNIKGLCLKLFKDPKISLQRPFIKGGTDFLTSKDDEEQRKKDCQEAESFQSGSAKEQETLPMFGPMEIITDSDWMS